MPPCTGEPEAGCVYWRNRLRKGTAGGAFRGTRMPEGLMSSPSGGPKGSNQLPRDKVSLSFSPAPRLAPTGFRPGLVTGMAVVVCFHLVRGTSVTARNRNVSGSSAAGRRPNANESCGFKRRSSNSTPRRNASVVVASGKRRRQA